MTAPFIFIGTHRIEEGKSEEFAKSAPDFCEFLEENEPRLLAFNMYLNEEGTEVSVVQVHPDADSMLFHMQLAQDHIERSYAGLLDPAGSRIQVFGQPTDAAVDMMRQLAGSGAPLTVMPREIGGFTRLQGV